jgi:hypothetical protein
MSQAGILDDVANNPQIPTTFNADVGSAIPLTNILEIIGGVGVDTTASGNTVVINASTTTSLSFTTDAGVANPVADNINVVGTGGITTSGAGSTVTIDGSAFQSFTWTVITGAAQALSVLNGYIGNRGTGISYTLPATANVGDRIRITNIGVGLPTILQNALQSINFTSTSTTVGVGGSLVGISKFASIELVCVEANLQFNVLSSESSWTIV